MARYIYLILFIAYISSPTERNKYCGKRLIYIYIFEGSSYTDCFGGKENRKKVVTTS